ncbi:hypothetical protein AAFN75_02585 [Algibacter sp. AS12]|uniref:hypothetical protein n=1 Tax=Algibacter sp. AS12 TaxID=3135773 RepID=UPI00398B8739
MNQRDKNLRRKIIISKTQTEFKNMKADDPFMDAVSIWIKFKESKNIIPIYFSCTLQSLPNDYLLEGIITRSLKYTSDKYKTDNSLSILNINLKTKINTDKRGRIIFIDATKK